ncbi:WD_0033/WD_0034 family tandem repeat-containing protein [Wolbachia pipientis]|uniref:WD_0033/WD_0034 family tandem repeat-containing protein n=1 Tax=Wolbachia pipientis TaxID=955 RepID=UPI0020305ED9|nr:hypothetical protein [Wolbachia pipientis]MCM1002672.1 hypothetical protein [Wolbachia pipientis]
MKAPKKIKKAIAKKFKNWMGSLITTASKETATDRTQEPSASSSTNKDLPGEVEKQKLLEVLKKEMGIEPSDGREENHIILTDAISRKDSRAAREILKLSEEYGILEEILNKKIIIKQANGQETSYTPFDYANENCKEIAKIIEEFKGDSNIPTEDITPVTDNIEVISTKLKDINKISKDLNTHQSICENSGETQNDTTQGPNTSNSLFC